MDLGFGADRLIVHEENFGGERCERGHIGEALQKRCSVQDDPVDPGLGGAVDPEAIAINEL